MGDTFPETRGGRRGLWERERLKAAEPCVVGSKVESREGHKPGSVELLAQADGMARMNRLARSVAVNG